jgi:hypothetical protein
MATKKVSKKEIDLVVPEFVSTFGTSLKPKAKENASSKQEKAKLDGSSPHESIANVAKGSTSSPASPPPHDAPKQPSSSPVAAFNSMQTLPSSPVKQALAKAQQSFGAKPAGQSKENASASTKVCIEVPEFVSTCACPSLPAVHFCNNFIQISSKI